MAFFSRFWQAGGALQYPVSWERKTTEDDEPTDKTWSAMSIAEQIASYGEDRHMPYMNKLLHEDRKARRGAQKDEQDHDD
jgi:hypothetical protein